mmetsp:Transcript_7994/g.18566  ORF Transcript_7994/g.18566 Transcript_7994/m.18566 type:complete len:136 (-) Transcript_7994:57-464(-)
MFRCFAGETPSTFSACPPPDTGSLSLNLSPKKPPCPDMSDAASVTRDLDKLRCYSSKTVGDTGHRIGCEPNKIPQAFEMHKVADLHPSACVNQRLESLVLVKIYITEVETNLFHNCLRVNISLQPGHGQIAPLWC